MRMSDWSSDVCSSDLPRELDACIASIRQLYPGKKLTMVFQPHLFSRTRDFADEFAESLAKVDELILLELYPASEKPLEGVNSSMLLRSEERRDGKECVSPFSCWWGTYN